MPPTIPKGRNAGALADWAEITLLGDESRVLSEVRIDKLLRGEALEVADEELEHDAAEETAEAFAHPESQGNVDLREMGDEGDTERDVRIEFLLEEIELRAKLGPKVYPFRVREEQIEQIEACGELVYRLLLVLGSSEAAYRSDRRAHEVERVYDQVALEALRRFLGRESRGLRFAKNEHDPDDPETRPQLFRDAIKWLRDRLDLAEGIRTPPEGPMKRHWEDDPEDDTRPILNSYEDGGVDVVVWWRFGDGRSGFPVLLAQCTVQLTWEDKLEDIKEKLWVKWIDFSMVPPQRALVIPFAVDRRGATFEDRSLLAGVVIERLRLLELFDELECEVLTSLVDDVTREWVDQELVTIQ